MNESMPNAPFADWLNEILSLDFTRLFPGFTRPHAENRLPG